MKPSVEDLYRMKMLLGLGAWSIIVAPSGDFDESLGEEAYIVKQDDERTATVYISPDAAESRARFLLAHELVHVVLADLEFIACNNRSIDIMEVYHRELERVCNTFARLIIERLNG